MRRLIAFHRSLFLRRRFFVILGGTIVLLVVGHFIPLAYRAGQIATVTLAALISIDVLLLYATAGSVVGERKIANRFSNGDPNPITVCLSNSYPFRAHITVLDEFPVELQIRGHQRKLTLLPRDKHTITYQVTPTRRGKYKFGALNILTSSPLALLKRRFRYGEGQTVKVYPSFQQMRRYELLLASNRFAEIGAKPVRQRGHTMEFDHIRQYTVGDDPRSLNWKATARRGELMVNQYRELRDQPVYCVVDTGRVMQIAFEQMSLLDYSINTSLALANIALWKGDRAGLVTFAADLRTFIPAEHRDRHLTALHEALYHTEPRQEERDFGRLAAELERKITSRALLLVFTDFDTMYALKRQLAGLKRLANRHEVGVILFQDTSVQKLAASLPEQMKDYYITTVAEDFLLEKRRIVHTLREHGILSLLTPPQHLTIRTINHYLSLKAKGVI